MTFKKGWATVAAAHSKESAPKNSFKSFKSGDTLVVKFKSADDVVPYYGYGMFGAVDTFVPETPSKRNNNGYVESDETPWDLASQYYYDLAKKNPDKEKELRRKGYEYGGKLRFMVGLFDVTSGEDVVVDFTSNQAGVLLDTLMDYAETDEAGNIVPDGDHEFLEMVFKLSKRGSGTNTTIVLSPVINVQRGLKDEERANLESEVATKPFNDEIFDDILMKLDFDDQKRALVKAEFDLSLIGMVAPAAKDAPADSAEASDPSEDF